MNPPTRPPDRLRAGPRHRGLRRGLLAGAAGLAMLAAAGALVGYVGWARRSAIGAQVAARYLADHGAPARVHIDRIDARGFVASLSVGPPERPDLVVERAEGVFAPGPTLGLVPTRTPRLTSLTLVGVRLRARWDGRRLSFGSLQRLVDQAARGPKGGASPDLAIQDGVLELDTPGGPLTLQGDARLAAGQLRSAALTLKPATLNWAGTRAEGLSASLTLAAAGDDLDLRGVVAAERIATRGIGASAFRAQVQGSAPPSLDGSVRAQVQFVANEVAGRGDHLDHAHGEVQIAGQWAASTRAYRGRVSAKVQADAASTPSLEVHNPAVDLDSAALQANLTPHAERIEGPIHGRVSLGRTRSPAFKDFEAGSAEAGGGGAFAYAGGQITAAGAASLRASGALAPARAAWLAKRLAPLSVPGRRAGLAAAARALSLDAPQVSASIGAGGARVTTPRAILLTAGGPTVAALTVQAGADGVLIRRDGSATGALRLALTGNAAPHATLEFAPITAAADRLSARTSLTVQGDSRFARNLHVAWRGQVDRRGGVLTATAIGCAPVAASEVRDAADSVVLRDLRGDVCPDGATPLVVVRDGRTQVAARVQALAAAAPAAQATLANGAIALRLAADRGGVAGTGAVEGLDLRDLATPARFAPLRLSGRAEAIAGGWRGRLAVALIQTGAPVATGQFEQDGTGHGRFQAETASLRFASPGLQPADLSPQLGRYASQASGPLSGSVQVGWNPGAPMTSSLELSTSGLDLRTPAGRLVGLAGRLDLSPLSPPATPGLQRLTAKSLQTPLPLTDLSAEVALTPTGLTIQTASTRVAGGRAWLSPLHVPLAPGGTLNPVLHLQGVELGQVLGAFNLSEALTAQAAVSGALPLSLGPNGVHVADGRLAADGPGVLTLHRKALGGVAATAGVAPAPGAPPTTAPAPNAMQDLAFQALEHLAFTTLTAEVDSRPGGRLGVVLHVVGRHDPPQAPPTTRVALFDLLSGHAFDKTLPLPKGTPIDLTLDTSLNFDDLLAQYGRLGHGVADSGAVQPHLDKVTPPSGGPR